MNSRESSKLSMFEVVTALEADADPVIINKMPGFTAHLADLNATIVEIRAKLGLQLHFKSFSAADKEIVRTTLVAHMVSVAAAVRALAVKEKQQATADEFHLTEAALKRVRNNDLVELARNIVSEANKDTSALQEYGIEKNDITALDEQATFFRSVIPSVRVSKVQQSGATKLMKEAFKKADVILELMDVLADTMQQRHPEFYSDYKRRREIVAPVSRTIPLRGTVRSESGNPLKGVTITIDGQPDTVKSTKTGGFRFKSLNDGIHDVHFALDGYQPLKMPFTVTNGIRSKQATILLTQQ